MIVSIHLPKCAGNTFKKSLRNFYRERLYTDYGDWVGDVSPEAVSRRSTRLIELKKHLPGLLPQTKCIHGHFYASKWLGLLERPRFFTIFRDPFEAIPSGYEFLARRPHIDQPSVCEFRESGMTLSDYIVRWPNQFSQWCNPLEIGDFAAIGLCSNMEGSVALFNSTFGAKIWLPSERFNVNPQGRNYVLDREEKRLIKKYHANDIALWKQAVERFEKDLDRLR